MFKLNWKLFFGLILAGIVLITVACVVHRYEYQVNITYLDGTSETRTMFGDLGLHYNSDTHIVKIRTTTSDGYGKTIAIFSNVDSVELVREDNIKD